MFLVLSCGKSKEEDLSYDIFDTDYGTLDYYVRKNNLAQEGITEVKRAILDKDVDRLRELLDAGALLDVVPDAVPDDSTIYL